MKKKIMVIVTFVVCIATILFISFGDTFTSKDSTSKKVVEKEDNISKDKAEKDSKETVEEEKTVEDQSTELNNQDDSQEVSTNESANNTTTQNSTTQNSNTTQSANLGPQSNGQTTSNNSSSSSNQGTVSNNSGNTGSEPSTPAVSSKYKDGSFTGTAEGFNGPLTVRVTISGDTIKSIVITDHSDDDAFIEEAMGVINKITSSQGTDVDVVSGATYSSNGIIKATIQALNTAKN